MIFTLNGCTIDTRTYEIRRDGVPVAVEPQVFDLLIMLLENRNRVVTRDEIIERVWNGRIVSDSALSSRVKSLRQAIGDDGTSQRIVRTVRRRGFRLVAEVTEVPDEAELRAEPTTRSGPAGDDPPAGNLEPPDAPPVGYLGRRAAAFVAAGLIAAMVVGAGVGWLSGWSTGKRPSPIVAEALGMPTGPGIAVLAFRNLSDDPALDFFSRALTEELVTELTRFSELRVAGPAATEDNQTQTQDEPKLARPEGVQFLLRGTTRRANSRVRVTAQLLRLADGTLLWADSYERHVSPADILAVQAEIASRVVAAIASISEGVIARDMRARARGKPPRDLSAYECAVRANDIMTSGFSPAAHLSARKCLEAAVESEPDYATGWAMLSLTRSVEFSQMLNAGPDARPLEQAASAARRAIRLAPENPLAHLAMAAAAFLLRDLDTFQAEAATALRLNPHDPLLLGHLGSWLAFSGRWDEGVALVRKAIALNGRVYPRWWHAAIAKDHYRKREYRAALAEFKIMNLPDWWWTQVALAGTYGQLGDLENAVRAKDRLIQLYPGFTLETAVMEHRKFSFQQSYIDHAVDGLRKSGLR